MFSLDEGWMGLGSVGRKAGFGTAPGLKKPWNFEKILRIFCLLFLAFLPSCSWMLQEEPGALSLFQDPGFPPGFSCRKTQHTLCSLGIFFLDNLTGLPLISFNCLCRSLTAALWELLEFGITIKSGMKGLNPG